MIINSLPKFLVGVTQRIDNVDGRAELRDALDQKLVNWLIKTGFMPVPVPNVLLVSDSPDDLPDRNTLSSWLRAVQPDAFVLSGGNDIGEYSNRDATERYILSWAEVNKIPVLGICRGLQIMAVWAGGSLKPVNGHVRTRHKLQSGLSGEVNSYHNFSLENCPTGFSVLATAEDGEIEAIRHKSLPWEGWMWHPEREKYFQPNDILRIKELFSR